MFLKLWGISEARRLEFIVGNEYVGWGKTEPGPLLVLNLSVCCVL